MADREEERLVPHSLWGLQTIEKKEEWPGIEKREGPGGSKSQTGMEREVPAIEREERTARALRTANRKGQNRIRSR
jgi:hypothetical protein